MSDSPSTPPRAERPPSSLVVVDGDVLRHVDGLMAADTSREVGGVLIGTADPALDLVVVTGSIALPSDAANRSVVFTREMWGRLTQFVVRQHPGHRIVGWYHSHPGFGIFVSSHDLLIHTTYFGQPWQVAYVFDPVQDERSFFGWRGNDLERITRWQTTSPARGLDTDLPAREPAHGPRSVRRHLASSVAEAPPAQPTGTVLFAPPPVAPIRAPEVDDDQGFDEDDDLEDALADDDVDGDDDLDDEVDEDLHDGLHDDLDVAAAGRAAGPAAFDADDDLDAWIATLGHDESASPAAPTPQAPATAGFPPPAATDAARVPPPSPPRLASPRVEMTPERKRLMIIVIGAVVAVALVVGLIVAFGSDDSKDGAATTSAPSSTALLPIVTASPSTSVAATTVATETTEPPATDATTSSVAATTPSTATTEPETTETTGATAATTTTVATLPPTPSAAVPPAARIGAAAIPCAQGADGFYQPVANCFVALQNGNVLGDLNGQLVCADPGTVIGVAAPFIIGFGGDPLSVISNGAALPSCSDLSYARSVMAAGEPTMSGLCGNGDAPIDDSTRRCFAQNLMSGSMIAIVRSGAGNTLAAQCFTATAAPALTPITWTLPDVDAAWRVTSTGYSPGLGQFVVTAERAGASASAFVGCT